MEHRVTISEQASIQQQIKQLTSEGHNVFQTYDTLDGANRREHVFKSYVQSAPRMMHVTSNAYIFSNNKMQP